MKKIIVKSCLECPWYIAREPIYKYRHHCTNRKYMGDSLEKTWRLCPLRKEPVQIEIGE